MASLGLVSKTFWDLFKMRNFAIFVFYTNIEFIPKISADLFFSLLHKKHVIYHTKFPNYLLKPFYPQNLLFTILPTKFNNFFLLASPLEMVSPGAAPPLRPRLSTPPLKGP